MFDVNGLCLFISSTFRDLQEEREHSTTTIFPKMIRRGRVASHVASMA